MGLGGVEEVGADRRVEVEGPDVDRPVTLLGAREAAQAVHQLLAPVGDQRRAAGPDEGGQRRNHRRGLEHVGREVGGGGVVAGHGQQSVASVGQESQGRFDISVASRGRWVAQDQKLIEQRDAVLRRLECRVGQILRRQKWDRDGRHPAAGQAVEDFALEMLEHRRHRVGPHLGEAHDHRLANFEQEMQKLGRHRIVVAGAVDGRGAHQRLDL